MPRRTDGPQRQFGFSNTLPAAGVRYPLAFCTQPLSTKVRKSGYARQEIDVLMQLVPAAGQQQA
jgi:hypothetical protein